LAQASDVASIIVAVAVDEETMVTSDHNVDSPASMVKDWAQQFAQSRRQVHSKFLQSTCEISGLVTVEWCNAGQGTGNCLNRVLTAALVAVVFNRSLAITGISRPAFGVGLEESQGTVMPWLLPPECLQLQGAGDFPTCSRGILSTRGGSKEKWHDMVCVDFSLFDIIHVDTFAFWDFGHLQLNRRTPYPFNERLMQLTAPGVNAYGLALHALWPHGLTRVSASLNKASLGRMNAGLHIRCHYTSCSKENLGKIAQCVAQRLDNHTGSSCNIFLASDQKDALEMAGSMLKLNNPECNVLVAADMRAYLASELKEEIQDSRVSEKGTHGDRETWNMPVDLEMLASSELVVGTRRSTLSTLVGASSGRLYYIGECNPWHHNFPLDDRGYSDSGFKTAQSMAAQLVCDEGSEL